MESTEREYHGNLDAWVSPNELTFDVGDPPDFRDEVKRCADADRHGFNSRLFKCTLEPGAGGLCNFRIQADVKIGFGNTQKVRRRPHLPAQRH